MAKDVVMPALGMAQETGTLLRWLKNPGESVAKGEMLMEVETDKALVEVEAPASGILSDVTAQPGDVIPVGQVIARIVAAGEYSKGEFGKGEFRRGEFETRPYGKQHDETRANETANAPTHRISPVAARIAQEQGIDVSQIKSSGGMIQKEDVLAYVAEKTSPLPSPYQGEGDLARGVTSPLPTPSKGEGVGARVLASPKARRLAQERGIALDAKRGSGPDGAVLASDVLAIPTTAAPADSAVIASATESVAVSNVWRVMVERLSQAWTTVPHFYLARDVNASQLMAWREAKKRNVEKVTYTDLLVKLVAAALQQHPRVNASWQNDTLVMNRNINIGLAVAVEAGLVVPVVHNADQMTLPQLTAKRLELIERAQAGKLSLKDITDGTFTISNLGMYGVDAFSAIVNPPQAAILAVSRIAERVVAVEHQPSVQPMMTLTLSCDHRVVDGARAAQFMDTLASLIEEPLSLLE